MRAILWPSLGALLIPSVAASLLAIRDPAALSSSDPRGWLALAGLGALAGLAFFLKARLTGDGDHPLSEHAPGAEAAHRRWESTGGDQLLAGEDQQEATLRQRASESRLGARRYRIHLETGIAAIDQLLASPDAEALDGAAIRRDRARLVLDLDWAKKREGSLGRWLA